MSAYNYVGNNPINNIDIMGDSITPIANTNYSQFMMNWDSGVSAGNYTLYGGTAQDADGNSINAWVARRTSSKGYHDDWVVDPESVGEFRANSGAYERNANIIDMYSRYVGMSLWDRAKEIYSVQNFITGATIYAGIPSRIPLQKNQGYTGLYNIKTNRAYLYKSVPHNNPPPGFLPRNGGHIRFQNHLVRSGLGNPGDFVGFAAQTQASARLNVISYRSISVNRRFHGNAGIASQYSDGIKHALWIRYNIRKP